MNQIPARLTAVRERIDRAAAACGRDPGTISLLAVSKTKPASDVLAAIEAGQTAFGENYLQDALPKIQQLADEAVEWHFIGRLQSNKTADIAQHFSWVHGLNALKHAERLSRQRPETLPPLQVCIQVNLTGEATKGGVEPGELRDLAKAISALPRLLLRGLMTMPDPASEPAAQQAVFAELRLALQRLQAEGLPVDTLSMGMSGDLELAIREGATMVRVGTDIFGARA